LLPNTEQLAEVAGMLRNLTDRRRSVGKSFNCIDIQNVWGYVKVQSTLDCCAADEVNLAKMLHSTDIE